MKIEIVANNDENFVLDPKNYAEIQPEPPTPEEVVEEPKKEEVVVTPQPLPSQPAKIGAPIHNQVESMKWI